MSKFWLKSKTILANFAVGALALAEANFGLLKPYLGESTYGVLLFVLIMSGFALRFATNSGVTFSIQSGSGDGKPPKKDP